MIQKWMSNLENNQAAKTKKIFLNEFFQFGIWENIKCTNICITGFQKEKRDRERVNKIFKEIMTKNFPNLGKETHPGLGMTESFKQDELKEVHNKT